MEWGCIVEESENVVSGLQKLKAGREPFEMVLLDHRMPGVDGTAFAAQMKSDLSLQKTPIVMLTSIMDYNICFQPGFEVAGCVSKPVRRSELKKVMATILGGIEATVQHRKRPSEPYSASALRLLLVDDSGDNRLLIESLLKPYPFTIDTAGDGLAALRQFQREKYDLVLMDMQMPIMDGYTATKEIRNWERQNGLEPTPVVALTAYALDEERLKSIDAGCDAHITKPIKKAVLLEAIQRHTRKKRLTEPR
jgi:CheY-like chemotaxis protein